MTVQTVIHAMIEQLVVMRQSLNSIVHFCYIAGCQQHRLFTVSSVGSSLGFVRLADHTVNRLEAVLCKLPHECHPGERRTYSAPVAWPFQLGPASMLLTSLLPLKQMFLMD